MRSQNIPLLYVKTKTNVINMNYKTILITLALCLCLAMPAMASNVPMYENKYHDTNPALDTPGPFDGSGILKGMLRSGGSVVGGGLDFIIVNTAAPDAPPMKARFLDDGTYETFLAPGTYNITLPQGHGSGGPANLHPESVTVTVVAKQITYFSFMGNALGTDRGNPKQATIDASLRCGDIDIKHWKLVQTGRHWVEPTTITVHHDEVSHVIHHDAVPAVPAHTEYFGDYARDGSHYDFVGVNQADYDVTFRDVGHDHGDYTQDGSHYDYVGHNNGHFDVNTVTDVGHVHHPAVPAVPAWDEIIIDSPAYDEEVNIPGYWQPEYGIEFFLEIDSAHIMLENPNRDRVNVAFSFDVNYFIDRRPWDHNAMPGQIEPRMMTYTGQINGVTPGITTYHGYLHPDIDNAVTVVDWEQFGMQYFPYISNAQVTGTTWG